MKTTHPLLACVIGLLATTLLCSTALAETKSAASIKETRVHFKALLDKKPGFYPECRHAPVPIRIKKEEFQKTYLTLSGLSGVHLNVDGLLKSASVKNTHLTANLKATIQQKLAKGGLKLLSKKEMEGTPGQPEMSMFMSFPAHLSPAKKGKKQAAYRPDCCTMGIWTSFSQAARILRDPDTSYKLGTWGEGHNTNDCSNPASWMSDVILKTVDNFVAKKLQAEKDYAAWKKKRNQLQKTGKTNKASKTQKLKQEVAKELAELTRAKKPTPAAKPKPAPRIKTAPKPLIQPVQYQQQPRQQYQQYQQQPYQQYQQLQPQYSAPVMFNAPPPHCNSAVRTYIDMFATNQAHIDSSNYYVLDLLASNIRSCPMYSYLIETHADPRSSFAHNERLSALRAASIQGHLLARGVDKRQFIIQSYGEINPVSPGSTSLDHAANRRVVVRPYLRRH